MPTRELGIDDGDDVAGEELDEDLIARFGVDG